MRRYILYQSDPWLDTSDVGLKSLCREIFKNERGCYDGYEKLWKKVVFTWGDEELGGSAEVENRKLETARIKIKAWDRKEGRMFEEEGEYWSWYQFYRHLSRIVWSFCPEFPYNPIHIYDVQVIADFWSFTETFSKHRDIEEEMKKLYVLASCCHPGLGKIMSNDTGLPFEIYTEASETLTVEKGVREILTCDNELKKEEVVRIYLPTFSTYEEFMERCGQELYKILSELDVEKEVAV